MKKFLLRLLCWVIALVAGLLTLFFFNLMDDYVLKESLRSESGNMFPAGVSFGYVLRSALTNLYDEKDHHNNSRLVLLDNQQE